jgi:capsular polysaccharide biosynthesis protein
MTLKQAVKFLQRNTKIILLAGLLGSLLGVSVHYLTPAKNIASGSLYITRNIALSPLQLAPDSFFSYEGYYAQQNAALYSATVTALLESTDLKAAVLRDAGLPVTERNLRQLSRAISVRKPSPQLISVSVLDVLPLGLTAEKSWDLLVLNIQQTHTRINLEGDSELAVVAVIEEPVVKSIYKNIYLNIIVGFVLGKILAVLFLSFASYISAPEPGTKRT